MSSKLGGKVGRREVEWRAVPRASAGAVEAVTCSNVSGSSYEYVDFVNVVPPATLSSSECDTSRDASSTVKV